MDDQQTNPVQTPIVINALDSFAKFSVQLANTSVIDQQSAQPEWQFCFAANQAIQPQVSFCMTPLALASSQDISGQIKSQSALLPGSIAPGTLPILNLVNVSGADWCARVNAGDAELGSGGGEMWLTTAAGSPSTCSADAKISAGHLLRDVGCGTYALQGHSILVSGSFTTGSAVLGCGREMTYFTATGNQSVIAPANATNNLTRNVRLAGFTVLAASSTGIGIDEHNANSWLVEDVRLSGFDGSGGVGVRIRGDGSTAGAYFDRHYNSFIEHTETAVLINDDSSGNIPTSYQFDAVHCNVVTTCYDIAGQTGWFRDDYVENVATGGYGIHLRSGGSNNFFRGMNLDNGSNGVGTGFQADSGANDNRFQGNTSGFASQYSDSGVNNDFSGANTALWKITSNGTFISYNAADADDVNTVRCGLTTNENCGIIYESWNGGTNWWAGQTSSNTYAIKHGTGSGVNGLEIDASGNTTITPTNGLDNDLNVNLKVGATVNKNIFLNWVNNGVTEWYWKNFIVGTLDLLDQAGCARLGFGYGTNGIASISGCGTGGTALAFEGSGGVNFGTGDGSTTIASVDKTGTYRSIEGTGCFGQSGQDVLCADSASHRWNAQNNNGAKTPVALLTEVPQLYNHSGTIQTAPHTVQDSCVLGTSCSVTLTGSAVFTSSTSYTCVCQDNTAIDACNVVQSSGSAFAITGTGTDTIRYICTGN